MSGERMPLLTLLSTYRDGDEHGWTKEFDWLENNHLGRLDVLTTSIQETGMHEPILLGNDGRVWDGHHRLAAAYRLAMDEVPVTFAPAAARPADPDHDGEGRA